MKSLAWKTWMLAAAAAGVFAPAAWAQQREEFDQFNIDRLIAAPPMAAWVQQLEGFPGVVPSSHWIGVACRPTDSVLHKQLKIEGGLVVEEVTPDSPAAKAGIEADDILLSINDMPLSSQAELMKFLHENKDKEVAIKYLHAGESKTAKLTPAERPADHFKFFTPRGEFEFKLPQGRDPAAWKKWVEEFTKEAPRGIGEPWRMRFFHPGVMLGDDQQLEVELLLGDLPKGLKVLINKEGDGPAKIHVERGDEKWDVTEKELDKLPEDIRAHVKRFLGRPLGFGIRLAVPKVVPLEGGPDKAVPAPKAPLRVEARAIQLDKGPIEKQLSEINQRLEKIEKALEKLASQKE